MFNNSDKKIVDMGRNRILGKEEILGELQKRGIIDL